MPASEFKQWVGKVISGDNKSLNGLENIEVKIVDLGSELDNKHDIKILVECGGVQKEVFASLFFNYDRPPANMEEIVTNASSDPFGFKGDSC